MYPELREVKDMLERLDKTREERNWDTILHNQEAVFTMVYDLVTIISDMAEKIEQLKDMEVA